MSKYSSKYVCNECSEPCEMLVKANYPDASGPERCPIHSHYITKWVFKWMRTTEKPEDRA